ncbi:MAG TPA: hypothetical protein VK912_19250 [Longimicrobiales bacterium]|nr:hypothetical protein [Longimicrobiales bacterium]
MAVTDAGVTRKASVAVVVSLTAVPAIESLSVHPTEAVLIAEPGQTLQLTVEAHDEEGNPIRNAPAYSSSAPEVATVSVLRGRITWVTEKLGGEWQIVSQQMTPFRPLP